MALMSKMPDIDVARCAIIPLVVGLIVSSSLLPAESTKLTHRFEDRLNERVELQQFFFIVLRTSDRIDQNDVAMAERRELG